MEESDQAGMGTGGAESKASPSVPQGSFGSHLRSPLASAFHLFPLCTLPFKLILGLSALPQFRLQVALAGPSTHSGSTPRGFSVWHSLHGSAFQCLSSRAPGGMSGMDGLHPPHPGTEGKKKVVGGVGCQGMKCEMAGIDLWVSRVSHLPFKTQLILLCY